MGKALFAVLFVVVAVAAGGGFLLTWDIPPPSERVEKVISNDRFPR